VLAGYTARVRIVWIYSFGGSDGRCVVRCVDYGVGLVVSLDYRKLGVQMPVQVGLYGSCHES